MKSALHPINIKQTPHSDTLWINETCQKLRAEGKNIIHFGFGESPFEPLECTQNELKNYAHTTNYLPVQGLPELQTCIKQFHSTINNTNLDNHEVFIAPGSKLLLFIIQAAFKKATIMLPGPSWVSYAPQADLCGHNKVIIPCSFENRWRVTPEKLDELATPITEQKILILNYPGNPDGLSYSKKELQALARVAKKHNILIIADEIYHLLHHTDNPATLANEYPEKTIICTGLSKWYGAGGWRLGCAFIPKTLGPDFIKSLKGIASETYSCTSSPIQWAAINAYQNNTETQTFLENQRSILTHIGQYVSNRLNTMSVRTHTPEGGFYVYPDFENYRHLLNARNINDTKTLCQRLLTECGVALLPGSAFNQNRNLLTCRLAYVDFDGTACIKKIQTEPATSHNIIHNCPNIIEGLDRIETWLKSC